MKIVMKIMKNIGNLIIERSFPNNYVKQMIYIYFFDRVKILFMLLFYLITQFNSHLFKNYNR